MTIGRTLAAGVLLLIAMPARAEERITNFISDVHVQPDGVLDVVETISLVSEGSEIQRGIQRDFPTRYPGLIGGEVKIGFDVIDVARDGHPEPYTLRRRRNGERVRIGNPDTMLAPGDHVYRIHYRTSRQLGFYRDFDELYWNATGTGWTFPIERAEARITLPRAVPFGKRAVYTGAQGATGHDATVVLERPGLIVFRTTRRLEAGEGLTVAAAWRKGIVAEPGALTRLGWLLRDNATMLLALLGLLAIALRCVHALWTARRNPDPRPLVPLFSPPDDLSAAALRYIWRMGSDDRTFAAAIVDAGVRGRLRIVETSPGAKPERKIVKVDAAIALPPAEEAMVARLFKGRKSVALRQTSSAVLIDARGALDEALAAAYGATFTDQPRKTLHGWTLAFGLVMAVALMLVVTSSAAASPLVAPGIAAVIVAGFVCLRLLSRARKALPEERRGRRLLTLIGSGLIGLMLVQLCGGLVMMAVASGNALPLIPALLAVPIVILTRIWLIVPTAQGWPLRGRIAGFRHYLAVAEEDRLEKLNPPEKTQALFERYLPYAMALGVENRWAKRFAGIVAAAAIDDTVDEDKNWYSGSAQPWRDPAAFASTMGSGLTATIASAARAPGSSSSGSSGSSGGSSSSGSSGGGSSGGGGGGGGGSGW